MSTDEVIGTYTATEPWRGWHHKARDKYWAPAFECALCGARLRYTGSHFPRRHNMTAAAYRRLTGDTIQGISGAYDPTLDPAYWTAARIVAAFQRYARTHGGRAPRELECIGSAPPLTLNGYSYKPARLPSRTKVANVFGNHLTAVRAAGLTPAPRIDALELKHRRLDHMPNIKLRGRRSERVCRVCLNRRRAAQRKKARRKAVTRA